MMGQVDAACGMTKDIPPHGSISWKLPVGLVVRPELIKEFPGLQLKGQGVRSLVGEPMVFDWQVSGPPDEVAAFARKLESMGFQWGGKVPVPGDEVFARLWRESPLGQLEAKHREAQAEDRSPQE